MFMILARIKILLLWFAVPLHISPITAWIFVYSCSDWACYFLFLAAFKHVLFSTGMCLQLESYAWWQKRHFKCECLAPYHSVWLLISLTSCCIWIDWFIPAKIALCVLVTGYPIVCNNVPCPLGQLLHLTPPHFSFNKSSQRMNFFGLFAGFITWRM